MNDDIGAMDETLARLAPYGPDLRNGLTNHAPMAAEALCAIGRPEAVSPWLDRYSALLVPRSAARERIPPSEWQRALGRLDLFPEWVAYFEEELEEASWRDVASRWSARLMPAVCASALHGVIRVAHAVRSLEQSESALRKRELAEGLAYWSSAYQTLPAAAGDPLRSTPLRALAAVPVVPSEKRRFAGTIVSSLEALSEFAEFGPVIDAIDPSPSPSRALSDVSEAFARAYLANAHDVLTTIVFLHAITGAAAIRLLLPLLDASAAAGAVRYGWQAGCALYATFATRLPVEGDVEAPPEDPRTLADLAVAHGDEHAIKLTEACLREHALLPSSAYLAAGRHALGALPRA
jgi:hypothetical protein